MSEDEYPKIQDLDNEAFIFIRQHLYQLLHELHMAENYKIVNPEKEYNVYWENFCIDLKYLPNRIGEAIYAPFSDES